jgi:hypothetical protein
VIGDESLQLENLVVLKSRDGRVLENFQGLSHHENGRYFMISDNDHKAGRPTLLYCFSFI